MRGILLAGGRGSRLGPLAVATSKQLLPVHDKPLIFYPLSTMMVAGIREILVITAPRDKQAVQMLLGSGQDWGISISYAEQAEPRGIAQALIIAEDFIGNEPCMLVLGDNIVFGAGLGTVLRETISDAHSTVFAIESTDPSQYAVVTFTHDNHAAEIIEKPATPNSNWIVPGIYFYHSGIPRLARELAPSSRGELEISDLNRRLLADNELVVRKLPRGTYWIDAGTPDALEEASSFVRLHTQRTGLSIGCPEEIALGAGWIGKQEVLKCRSRYAGSSYGDYLDSLVSRHVSATGS